MPIIILTFTVLDPNEVTPAIEKLRAFVKVSGFGWSHIEAVDAERVEIIVPPPHRSITPRES